MVRRPGEGLCWGPVDVGCKLSGHAADHVMTSAAASAPVIPVKQSTAEEVGQQ